LRQLKTLRRSATLSGAVLSAALALAGLTISPAGATAVRATTNRVTANVVPNVAPVRGGIVSDVCSAPKQRDVASCLALRVNNGRTGYGVRDTTATAPSGYGPTQLLSAYDLPADGGAGATIAIVDAYDDPNAAADLAVYRQQFGLPALQSGQFRKVNQDGFPGDYPVGDPSWATEISLDLDMVSAIAPKADIILVEANTPGITDLGASEDEAVELGASYVSNSYAATETSEDPQYVAEYYDHPGVALVAGAGDAGYGVRFPAAAPHVTAAGGTDLTKDPGTARGWTETAWSDTGSGCSTVESKPSFQTDTGCAKRTVNDVSAVADPYTGVAVYDSYSDGTSSYGQGWGQFGGTSVASPIIAATYALGGPIGTGDFPNADPYAHTADLNDVTSGSNGTCSPAYLCTAGTGYNGPTGLGTPDGTGAFTDTSYGTLTGTVTTRGGKPAADARIHLTGADSVFTTTDSDGDYQVRLPAGSYRVSVTGYTYQTATVTVTITVGSTVRRNVSVRIKPEVTLSGVVSDGSGHGWPVQSSIVIDYGTGTLTTLTSPLTGRYSIRLPGDSAYTVEVTPEITGYATLNTAVTVPGTSTTRNFAIPADLLASEGSAPGYAQHTSGTTQTFTSGALPSGWTSVTTTGTNSWTFQSSAPLAPPSGAAVIFSNGTTTDASLYTPVVSVPAGRSPLVSFQESIFDGLAQVDVSTDGGTTWQTQWSELDSLAYEQVEFALPSSTVTRAVQLRFRYQALDSATSSGLEWQITDVLFGSAWLTLKPGGLVAGTVTDANTGKTLDGVSVAVSGQPGSDTSAPLAGAGDGFYYLFSPRGKHTLTGTLLNYGTGTRSVTVAANAATKATVAMPAGRIATSGNVSATVSKNGTATRTLTLTNTGHEPATVVIDQFPGTASASGSASAATATGGSESFARQFQAARKGQPWAVPSVARASAAATPSAAPGWSTLASMPGASFEGVAGSYDGIAYAGLGADDELNPTGALYSYNPATKAWTTRASAPMPVAEPGYGVIGDDLYVTGGVGGTSNSLSPVTQTQVYDMATNTWSTAAANPYALSGTDAVLDGELYQIGGISLSTFQDSDIVSAYNPSAGTWTEVAPYPVGVTAASCGGVGGTLYCAGGYNQAGIALTAAYKYTPGDSSWQPIASLPQDLGGSAFGVADGELLVSGGTTSNGMLTSVGYAYDPAQNWWVPLPAAATPKAGAAGVLGFYTFGGEVATGTYDEADQLLGYGQVGRVSLPWLSLSQSKLRIQPGHKARITIRLDGAEAGLGGGGTVTAALGFETDTPYQVVPVGIKLSVS
jgi:N-acetylneuraminic acid mutarotase